jgi:hypothetical protein
VRCKKSAEPSVEEDMIVSIVEIEYCDPNARDCDTSSLGVENAQIMIYISSSALYVSDHTSRTDVYYPRSSSRMFLA